MEIAVLAQLKKKTSISSATRQWCRHLGAPSLAALSAPAEKPGVYRQHIPLAARRQTVGCSDRRHLLWRIDSDAIGRIEWVRSTKACSSQRWPIERARLSSISSVAASQTCPQKPVLKAVEAIDRAGCKPEMQAGGGTGDGESGWMTISFIAVRFSYSGGIAVV